MACGPAHLLEPGLDLGTPASAGAPTVAHASATPQIHELGVKAGVVINPGTPLAAVEEVLDVADLVLIMTVNPGFGGQKFLQSQVRVMRTVRGGEVLGARTPVWVHGLLWWRGSAR